jgi:hypothetical protein
MGKVFHKHPVFTTYASDKTCGILNGHDASCSKHGLTNDNETDCEVDSIDSSKCKCTHKVPDDKIDELPEEFIIVKAGARKRAGPAKRKAKAGKKSRPKKKKAFRRKTKGSR